MSDNQNTGLVAAVDRAVEFKAFGSEETVRLSIRIVQDTVCNPTKSGVKCSEKQATYFMLMCRARGLNPFEGDAYLIGYDGKNGPEFSLITAHQAFLKRAELHPEFDGMESGVIVLNDGKLIEREGDFTLDSDTLQGGWATVFFKNRKHPIRRKLNLKTFNKGYSQWAANPAGMIVKCAEADALRSAFPTKLGGLYLAQEREFQPEIVMPPEPAQERSKAETESMKPTAQESAADQSTATLFDEAAKVGVTFQDIIQWGDETGNIPDATSIPSEEEFPANIAKRLLRAKDSMFKAILSRKQKELKV